MNAKQARQVPITLILEKMGLKPIREKNNEAWYKSPFRNEKTESFHVHIHKNVWFDFGEGKGGNVVDLVCKYLEATGYDHQVPDALRWIKNMTVSYVPDKTLIQPTENKESKLSVKRVFSLKHVALIHYLEKRGIPESLARKYTKEVHAHNKETGKGFFAIGFKNDINGWELRNKGYKGTIPTKTITFIRGIIPKHGDIHIFEGFMDFLSVLVQNNVKNLDGDSIVLNSTSCLEQALPYLYEYGYKNFYTWLDNDVAGRNATIRCSEFATTQNGLVHRPMNEKYIGHKDVNEWHMHTLNLTL